MIDISNLNNKTQNKGADESGRLAASEWNTLVSAVEELQDESYVKPSTGIPTTDITDENLSMTQAEINQLVIGSNITVGLSASPSPIFVGTQRTISLSATCSRSATSITIKKGSTVLATGSGTSLGYSDTITPGRVRCGWFKQDCIQERYSRLPYQDWHGFFLCGRYCSFFC